MTNCCDLEPACVTCGWKKLYCDIDLKIGQINQFRALPVFDKDASTLQIC